MKFFGFDNTLFAWLSAALLTTATAQSTFTPASPPAIPLAVKSPYFSTWLQSGSDGGNGGYLPGRWPQFHADQVTAWTGMIRVDGKAYIWMGDPGGAPLATQTAFEYTSTKSIFTLNVDGKVELNVTFLSTLNPADMKRHSLLFSYLDVGVQSLDGASHEVQIYTDISAEWVTGDPAANAEWDYGVIPNVEIAYHKVWRQQQLQFSEHRDGADWGYWYWSTEDVSGLSRQSGVDKDVRSTFIIDGYLTNAKDTNFRPVNQNWPVFAFSRDLGTVTANPQSTLFTLGLCQDLAIQFSGANGLVKLPSLWRSYFSTDLEALEFHFNDYIEASRLASEFDHNVQADSVAAGGQDYATITSISARQAFGALQLVGTIEKPYLFLKEISSNGNTQTVDVVFPFHPILLYTAPHMLKLLLDPHFEYQETGRYPNKWAVHDLGAHYPNATGHDDGKDEPMPLEECGNMLIMTLGYYQHTQDLDYLKQHYPILKQWTSFLVDESLIPAEALSTDDFAGPLVNQTNLALKGMIGIEAFAHIARAIGNTVDADNYTAIAHDYIDKWQVLGVAHDDSPPHTTLSYGKNDTHGLLYNLYGDRLLDLNLVPQSVYDMQSAFYKTIAYDFGVPLDTRHNWTKSDWEMFTAAIANDDTKTLFIQRLARFVRDTPTALPFTDLYDAPSGGWPIGMGQFRARPVAGGHFALLALPQTAAASKMKKS
ncbi:glutaminase GtaA [Bisporella sp. PMI_857]|nr:glutaminase GtaA [Bisporella sp. PMI_857]